VEIGGQQRVTVRHVRAIAQAIQNAMRWAGMLLAPRTPSGYTRVLTWVIPFAAQPIPRAFSRDIHYLVRPGEMVKTGTPLARL